MTNEQYINTIMDKMETIKKRITEVGDAILDRQKLVEEARKEISEYSTVLDDYAAMQEVVKQMLAEVKKESGCPAMPVNEPATVLVPKEETQSFFPPKTCDQGKDMVPLCEPRRECPPFQQCPFDDQASDREKILVRTLLTIDGKGQEAKRQALTTLLGVMNPMKREALIAYAEICDRRDNREGVP